jgi:hypothetical protein
VADSQQLINRIRSGDQSADAELRAIQLLRSEDPARRVELEPTVDENRKCDFRIKRGSEAWVYVEVTRPDTSNAQYRVQMVLQSICDQVASVNRPFALEVFLRREPSDVELDTVSAAALDLCSVDQPADRVIRTEMPDGIGLFILNQHATSQVVLDDHGEEKVPRLGMSQAIIGLGQPNRHVVVRMPFADQRAERFLTTEKAAP